VSIDGADGIDELIMAVAAGEPGALQHLYKAQGSRLFGIAMAILRDPDAAADVLHDAVVRIAAHAAQFDPTRGEGSAWLAAIVRYAALDLARARGREIPTNDPALGNAIIGPEALDRVVVSEEARHLRDCLAALDTHKREGILLAFVHGLSHPQIAAKLNRPLGSVKAWIRRGLAQLRECLT